VAELVLPGLGLWEAVGLLEAAGLLLVVAGALVGVLPIGGADPTGGEFWLSLPKATAITSTVKKARAADMMRRTRRPSAG
jgi:hypothetical protein